MLFNKNLNKNLFSSFIIAILIVIILYYFIIHKLHNTNNEYLLQPRVIRKRYYKKLERHRNNLSKSSNKNIKRHIGMIERTLINLEYHDKEINVTDLNIEDIRNNLQSLQYALNKSKSNLEQQTINDIILSIKQAASKKTIEINTESNSDLYIDIYDKPQPTKRTRILSLLLTDSKPTNPPKPTAKTQMLAIKPIIQLNELIQLLKNSS